MIQCSTFTTLWANSADNKLMLFSNGDNLYEMSNPVSWEGKKGKYFKILSAENFTQSAKQ